MSQRQYAARVDVSHVYINRLVRQGKIPADADGRIDPAEADAAIAALREPARPLRRADPARPVGPAREVAAATPSGAGRPIDSPALPHDGDLSTVLLKSRLKTEIERGKLLEIKAKVEAGKYVDVDEVRVAAFNKGRAVRDNLLNIPGRLAALVAAESDERRCHDLIDAEIKAALKVLAGDIGEA
jgi:hypothetical protein